MTALFTIATGYKARIIVGNKLKTAEIIAANRSGIVTLRWNDVIYWRHKDQLLPPQKSRRKKSKILEL